MSETAPTLHCSRLEKDLPAIAGHITFAGEFGAKIRASVSQPAWREWMELQIKIINEYKLHLGEADHRKFLQDMATKFFRFDGGDGTLDAGPGPEGGL